MRVQGARVKVQGAGSTLIRSVALDLAVGFGLWTHQLASVSDRPSGAAVGECIPLTTVTIIFVGSYSEVLCKNHREPIQNHSFGS